MSASATEQTVAPSDLRELLSASGETLVTIVMPTHRSGPETRGDAIEFKNLVDDALAKLASQGISGEAGERFLSDAVAKKNDATFWQNQTEGLLYLTDGDSVRVIHLRHAPVAGAKVGKSYDLSAAIVDQVDRRRCHVLAITKQRAELFEVTNDHCEKSGGDSFPATYDDLITERDPEKHLQSHSQGVGGQSVSGVKAPIFHGQGLGESKLDADEEFYYARVLELLGDAVDVDRDHLAVFATEGVIGHLLAHADFQPCFTIQGSIDGMKPDQMKTRMLEAFAESHDQDEPWAESFGTAAAADQASTNLDEILQSLENGRVATLLVRRESLQHGGDADQPFETLDSETMEQVSKAMTSAMQTGATVQLFSGTDHPIGESPIGAIYRY